MAKELYVGHISEQATEEDLRKLFEIMGVVTSVHLIVDQDSGEFKRCGYVRMLSNVDLKEVVETLDGTWLIDRCIVVSIAKPQNERPAKTPFVKRKPAAPRPAATQEARPAQGKRPAAAKSAAPARAGAKPAGKAGASAAPTDTAKKFRPKGTQGAASGERSAPVTRGAGRPSGGKRPGAGPRPSGRGQR